VPGGIHLLAFGKQSNFGFLIYSIDVPLCLVGGRKLLRWRCGRRLFGMGQNTFSIIKEGIHLLMKSLGNIYISESDKLDA
jgi:hypothetical protein